MIPTTYPPGGSRGQLRHAPVGLNVCSLFIILEACTLLAESYRIHNNITYSGWSTSVRQIAACVSTTNSLGFQVDASQENEIFSNRQRVSKIFVGKHTPMGTNDAPPLSSTTRHTKALLPTQRALELPYVHASVGYLVSLIMPRGLALVNTCRPTLNTGYPQKQNQREAFLSTKDIRYRRLRVPMPLRHYDTRHMHTTLGTNSPPASWPARPR